MSKVVVKNSKTEAWVKVVADSQQTISMADLAFNGITPSGAAIKHIDWAVEDGEVIHVRRGPGGALVDIFNFTGSGEMGFQRHEFVLEEYSDTSIVVVGKTGSKDYNIILGLVKIE
jgi:hypothetical protein